MSEYQDRDAPERLAEDRAWVEQTGLARRHVLAGGAFAAGFAAACRPVASSAVQTPADGLSAEQVTIPAPDGFAMPAFVARPEGVANPPVILVIHEIFGVHEWIRDICRRLAKVGYMAVAPDLFARAGDATKVADTRELLMGIVSATPDTQVLSDIDATYDWAGAHGADATRRGITGFCWGGRIVWLYAAHSAALDAGVAYYGRLVTEKNDKQTLSVIEQTDNLKAPVLGEYGSLDRGIPLADVEEMRRALKASGQTPPTRITVHEGADHGFLADYRPSYNEAAAKAAWAETLDWFAKYVKGD